MSAARPALFALVGVAFLAHWVIADPSYDASDTQNEWPYVLLFSGVLALLAVALPVVARLGGGPRVWLLSLVAAAAVAFASASNVVEDGLRHEWAFLGFVLATLVLDLALAALVLALALGGRGANRLFALVPGGTFAAIFFYVPAGGPLMLVTWLGAAEFALLLGVGARARIPAADSVRG